MISESEQQALAGRAEAVAARLGLMANPTRLLILCALAEGECAVGVLQARLHISQSALSQHLAKLRGAGVVATRREAQTIHYRLVDPQVTQMMAALYATFCQPQGRDPTDT